MTTPSGDSTSDPAWDDIDEQSPVSRRVLRLLGAISIVVMLLALVLVGVVLFAQRTYSRLPVDGFFKHDDAKALLKIAESVPVPPGLIVVSRVPSQGTGDVNSDGEITYTDPQARKNLCNLAVSILTANGWNPRALSPGEVTAVPPGVTKPKNPQIMVTCGTFGIYVDADGQ